MLEARAMVPLDDQELDIVIDALKMASAVAEHRDNRFRARLTEVLAMKIIGAKVRYQDKNVAILEEKYGIKEEKPAL